MRDDLLLVKSDVILLNETWLLSDEVSENFRANKFQHSENIKTEKVQLTRVSFPTVDVIRKLYKG